MTKTPYSPWNTYLRLALAVLLVSTCWQPYAWAQESNYPDRPIRILIGFAYGSITDVFSRILGQKLQEKWGQPVIVESRAGASGAIQTAALAKAKPDGYTIGIVISTHATNPFFQPQLPYDALRDFAPITMLGRVPIVMTVNPSVIKETVAQIVAKSKESPRSFSFGSAGTGGMTHLAGELFKRAAGIDIVHVSYKGGAAALKDLLGGQIPLEFSTVGLVAALHKSGKLKTVAIASKTRSAALPDVPTFTELGFPEVVVEEWYAMVAPAGTPAPILLRLNTEIGAILKMPDVQRKMTGMDLGGSTPGELDSFIRSEAERWSKLISAANLKME